MISKSSKVAWLAVGLVAGAVLMALVLVLGAYLRSALMIATTSGVNYATNDLAIANLPPWNPSLPIPLSPDRAVVSGLEYLKTNQPTVAHWDVEKITLNQFPGSFWYYEVTFVYRQGHSIQNIASVAVLLNGHVWPPQSAASLK